MRRLIVLLPGAVSVVCAAYTGIYLVRWEWNRAIIAGVFFLASEVIVASLLVLDRIRQSEARIVKAIEADRNPQPADPLAWGDDPASVTLEALQASSPEPADRFSWIREQSGGMNVFLPVLLGAGVLASALAWVVERLARATVSPALERRLAVRLGVLALPAGGLLGPPATLVPRRRRSWSARIAIVALVAVVGVLTSLAIDYVADRTQTRPDAMDPNADTMLELQLYGALADRDPDRAFHHLWTTCTGPDVFRARELPMPVVHHGADGAVRVLVATDVGENGLERLRGCLNDATLDKVQARVVNASVG